VDKLEDILEWVVGKVDGGVCMMGWRWNVKVDEREDGFRLRDVVGWSRGYFQGLLLTPRQTSRGTWGGLTGCIRKRFIMVGLQ
jgi:hypothetical protein